MKLDQIKAIADAEESSVTLKHINELFHGLQSAMDVRVDNPDLFERLCDARNLPCCYVAEDFVAIAPTYVQLYHHERRR